MNINFDNRSVPVYKQLGYQTKAIQEMCETVVPDTEEDIGNIVTVQSSVLLKGKDNTGRGVLITGEVYASVIYVNEVKDKISYIKLKRAFTIEYELNEVTPDMLSHINLRLVSSEARLINPRKISVCFEISGELSCYTLQELNVEYGVPTEFQNMLHTKYDNIEINAVSAACEKTFSLTEQINFPTGKPKPSKLIFADSDIVINDTQLVGTKVIVKGNAELYVHYHSDEVNYPVKTEFVAPFSQIIDIGDKTVDTCCIVPEITGIYYNLADSIGGEKILDLELRAVLQLVSRSSCNIAYISDAYSNLMPTSCNSEKDVLNHVTDYKKIKAVSDERLNISEDCVDVLCVYTCLSHLKQQQQGIVATVNLDVLYRSSEGELKSVRRNVKLECELREQSYRINYARLIELYIRPDGQNIECHIALEAECIICGNVEIERLCSVSLDEEKPIELDKFPTVTLVRCSGETVWDLAKTYHSSVERIKETNDIDCDLKGRMIMIPKCI